MQGKITRGVNFYSTIHVHGVVLYLAHLCLALVVLIFLSTTPLIRTAAWSLITGHSDRQH